MANIFYTLVILMCPRVSVWDTSRLIIISAFLLAITRCCSEIKQAGNTVHVFFEAHFNCIYNCDNAEIFIKGVQLN